MKQITTYLIASILLLGLANCDKKTTEPEPTPSAPEKILIASDYAYGSGLLIEYYAYDDPFVGYNKIYIAVKDSITEEKMDDVIDMTFVPMMDMGMMMHSCPTEALVFNTETKLYEGAVVFVMPSTAGQWMFNVTIDDNDLGLMGSGSILFDVAALDEEKLLSFQSAIDPDAMYFVSLVKPENPKVGENTYEILINRRASMMDWPYEPYLTVEIEPEMPSMNHGSPNNVNPIHVGMGHYRGVANFTMTGWWRINMVIKDGEGNVLGDEIYFDITF